jgi:pyruvate/2-oxoglutarate dehydrogenase complex dihydrolipoamide acyltransferase (E2) component
MIEFKIPELGENVATGDVTRVLVKVGETIAREQPVLELETDKATIEVPSSVAGIVKEIKVKQGDKVKVGAPVLVVEDDGAAAKPREAPAAKPTEETPAAAAPAAAPAEARPVRAEARQPEKPDKVVAMSRPQRQPLRRRRPIAGPRRPPRPPSGGSRARSASTFTTCRAAVRAAASRRPTSRSMRGAF